MFDTSKPPTDFPADYLPLLWTVGSTYNVLSGKYADPLSCRQQVIDWSKSENRTQEFGGKKYSVPLVVNFHNAITSDYRSASGKSTMDYSKSLTINAGLEAEYGGFSGSATADYSDTQRQNLAHSFTRVSYNVTHYTFSLPSTSETRGLLKKSFVQDLDSMDPVKLYDEYGTHLLLSATVGGRAAFLYTTDIRKYSSEISIEAAAKITAKYGVASGSVKLSTKEQEAMNSFTENSEVSVQTQGGDPQYGNTDFLSNVKAWAASITDWPQLVDFGSTPCLTGLWEFASTPQRRDVLAEAFKKFASGNGNKLGLPGPYVRVREAELSGEGSVLVPKPDDGGVALLCFPEATDPWYPIGFGDLVVSEEVPGALSPVKWEEAFTAIYTLTAAPLQAKFWRAIPPTPDYAVLGCIGISGVNVDLPDRIAKQVRAVHKSALTKAKDLSKLGDFGTAKYLYYVDDQFCLPGPGLHVEDCYNFDFRPEQKKAIKDSH
ncbi:MAC/Perforin domain-containing protein [Hygrophoropsis aurantiaca]|uniref:MAC/Perforin domain-containing protein n=1 Tax=Hygrophoropsis aurantiaca TaxID=72124 RepID=A0ACB7ZUZ0_9AGAM|nr:MAC/Perforin domain-containing protein [Hygrophoropsis aurantiaca]